MDPELIAYLDQRFGENTQQISALREEVSTLRQDFSTFRQETAQRFERVEDTSRQTLVLVERLRSDVHLIAEGFVGVNERLERFQSEATLVFDEVKGWIEPYYRNVDGRVRVLEGRAERQQGDVLDAVRRMLGRPPLGAPIPSE
jgi:methyl-accepting chemotaxis protein